MIVKLEGKKHCEGQNKDTGRNYNYHKIFFLYHDNVQDKYVDGNRGYDMNVPADLIKYEALIVGQYYEIIPSLSGKGADSIHPAKP